jgi:hypothetical protein
MAVFIEIGFLEMHAMFPSGPGCAGAEREITGRRGFRGVRQTNA